MQAVHLSSRAFDRQARARNALMTASLTLTASRFRLLRPALTFIWIHHHAVKLWAARFFVHGHTQRRNTVYV
jgi:hypothetical protein